MSNMGLEMLITTTPFHFIIRVWLVRRSPIRGPSCSVGAAYCNVVPSRDGSTLRPVAMVVQRPSMPQVPNQYREHRQWDSRRPVNPKISRHRPGLRTRWATGGVVEEAHAEYRLHFVSGSGLRRGQCRNLRTLTLTNVPGRNTRPRTLMAFTAALSCFID